MGMRRLSALSNAWRRYPAASMSSPTTSVIFAQHIGRCGTASASSARSLSGCDSPYEVLDVAHDATQEELKQVYVALAKKYHPDRTKVKADAEFFKEIQSAWYVVGDPARRAEFDEHGTLAAPPSTWSPLMWARLRKARPEDGGIAPNWGTDEPPQWLIAFGPLSVICLAMLFSARNDIISVIKDKQRLRAGGWPCETCLTINGPSDDHCLECGLKRGTPRQVQPRHRDRWP